MTISESITPKELNQKIKVNDIYIENVFKDLINAEKVIDLSKGKDNSEKSIAKDTRINYSALLQKKNIIQRIWKVVLGILVLIELLTGYFGLRDRIINTQEKPQKAIGKEKHVESNENYQSTDSVSILQKSKL